MVEKKKNHTDFYVVTLKNHFAVDVMNPLERYFDRNEVEVVEHDNHDGDRFAIPGFDIDGPRLPEEGLKSRTLEEGAAGGNWAVPFRKVYVNKEDFCARDSRSM